MIGLLQRRTSGVADLKVGRLRLVAILPEMLLAEQAENGAELGRLLGAKLTKEWPPADWEPHVFRFILKQYEEWPHSLGWHRYVLLESSLSFGLGRSSTLIGAVGGFPKPGGDVEVGYSTLPEFQRRGYATAFAKTLVDWMLTLDEVQSVSAQTYPRLPESIKIMERCGMSYVGTGDDEGTVRYRRVKAQGKGI